MREGGSINSIRNLPKSERLFFEDDKGYIRYHETCLSCSKSCKQSFTVLTVSCARRKKAHTPDEYLKRIKRLKKDINTIGKEIRMNSRTVKSMLYERQDMSQE